MCDVIIAQRLFTGKYYARGSEVDLLWKNLDNEHNSSRPSDVYDSRSENGDLVDETTNV